VFSLVLAAMGVWRKKNTGIDRPSLITDGAPSRCRVQVNDRRRVSVGAQRSINARTRVGLIAVGSATTIA